VTESGRLSFFKNPFRGFFLCLSTVSGFDFGDFLEIDLEFSNFYFL